MEIISVALKINRYELRSPYVCQYKMNTKHSRYSVNNQGKSLKNRECKCPKVKMGRGIKSTQNEAWDKKITVTNC